MTPRIFVTHALLVFAGGFLGTLLRALCTLPLDRAAEPWALMVVNLVGAFMLGVFVSVMNGRFSARAQRLRMFVSVGVLGGFTSYSALALDTTMLLDADPQIVSLVYAALMLVLGLAASTAGLTVGGRRNRDGGAQR